MSKVLFWCVVVIGCGVFLGIVLLPSPPTVEFPAPLAPEGPRSTDPVPAKNPGLNPAESAEPPVRPVIRPRVDPDQQTNPRTSSGRLPATSTAASTAAETAALPETEPMASAIKEPQTGAEFWTLPPLLQANARTNYNRAMEKLATADSPFKRYQALGDAAKWSFIFGHAGAARSYAGELLFLDERYKTEPWQHGGAVHDGNLVLGRIALQDGRVEEARDYLLKAGETRGSPVLGSFGPNMALARDLLQSGERQAVLDYFERCRKFWSTGEETLRTWTADVQAGRMPDFGPNLIY